MLEQSLPGRTLSFGCLIKLFSGLPGSNQVKGHRLSVRANYGVALARGKDLFLLSYHGWEGRDLLPYPLLYQSPIRGGDLQVRRTRLHERIGTECSLSLSLCLHKAEWACLPFFTR